MISTSVARNKVPALRADHGRILGGLRNLLIFFSVDPEDFLDDLFDS